MKLLLLAQVFACTVGQKPSKAPFYVTDTAEVTSILGRLAQPPVSSPPSLPPVPPPAPAQQAVTAPA